MENDNKWALWVGISLILGGPFVYLLTTIMAMIEAFKSIAESGMGDAELLSRRISEALSSNVYMLISIIIGLVFVIIYLLTNREENRSNQRSVD